MSIERLNDADNRAADDDDETDAMENAAAEWVILLAGKHSMADKAAWQEWIASDLRRALAFKEAQIAWSAAGSLKMEPGDLRRVVSPPRKKLPPGKAIIFLLGIGACGLAYELSDPFAPHADYRTVRGELRSIVLEDGSKVELGPKSAISLHFNTALRGVELLQGSAYFVVAPRQGAEMRPFTVEAVNGRTTALGTQFVVEDKDASAEVTSIEHQIEVVTREAGPNKRTILSPGDQVHYDAVNGIGTIRKVDLDKATAWRRGLIIFDNISLKEAVSTLNRYQDSRIVIANGELAAKLVSGVFKITNVDHAVDTIATELGARKASAPLITILY